MNKSLEIVIAFRRILLTEIEELSVEKLNQIPAPFSNNIIWNLAHMNAVLQALCYRASNVPMRIEESDFLPYLPGTKPERDLDAAEIERIKKQFIELPQLLAEDIEKGIFVTYQMPARVEKRYGIKIENIQDAVTYTAYHDSTHLSAVKMLKRM
ncbi:MAG: DinB family protein [Chitinophagaceae bacterium]|nr:DinB family protein [Chitinophagaceae bacterium]